MPTWPERPSAALSPMRCRRCFYILDHLESDVCPECGTVFDPADSSTFTRKPPFVWWTFWMPALLLAGLGGGVLWSLLIIAFGYTFATTVTVPVVIGVAVGYTGKTPLLNKFLLGILALAVAITILAGGGLVGGFCASIVAVIAMVPVFIGVLAGHLLRGILAQSSFSHREYLRGIFIQLMVALTAVAIAAIEGRHSLTQPVVVHTAAIIDVPPMQAWHGIQFFEQVRRPVPWLLRLSPSLRPAYTVGRSEKVGDIKTCVYQHGKLVKQITEVIPGRRLAFRVIEQDQIETDGAILLDGSFDLQPTSDGRHTRVVLTTRYVPKLNPRFAYQWAESLAIHTLHGHVLAGMKDKAEGAAE